MSNSELEKIRKEISACTKCALCKSAIQAVPGSGNPNADIVFIGEAPGFYEDQQGVPFVGRSGKLLDFLLGQIRLSRDDVWIGNIIKHRPPDNRDPSPEEISTCKAFLTRQLEAINPKIIITLGRFSMNYFFVDGKISRDHGRFIKAGAGSKKFNIFPMYHPAAALRNPTVMDEFMKDFIQIPKILDQLKNATSGSVSAQTPIEPEDKNQLGLGL